MAALVEPTINRFTSFMSTTTGFVLTNVVMVFAAGVTWAGLITVDDFTLGLSIAAITLTSAVLVSSRRDTEALQAKADETVRALPEASNSVVGMEKGGDL